jgi:hypothetical protein
MNVINTRWVTLPSTPTANGARVAKPTDVWCLAIIKSRFFRARKPSNRAHTLH